MSAERGICAGGGFNRARDCFRGFRCLYAALVGICRRGGSSAGDALYRGVALAIGAVPLVADRSSELEGVSKAPQ